MRSSHAGSTIDIAFDEANLLPGAGLVPVIALAEQVGPADLDSTHRQVYGYQKQGARVGRLKGKRTLHPLLAALSTPLSAPVVAGIRMRAGRSADVRGAAAFLAEALGTARAAGATGTIIVRGDQRLTESGSARRPTPSPLRRTSSGWGVPRPAAARRAG